jgi:hypothetical protein
MKKDTWKKLDRKTKSYLSDIHEMVFYHPKDFETEMEWIEKDISKKDWKPFLRVANKVRSLHHYYITIEKKLEKDMNYIEQQINKLLP